MAKKGNKNSLKHGIYAKKILLPNESAEEFEQHLQEFRLPFPPSGIASARQGRRRTRPRRPRDDRNRGQRSGWEPRPSTGKMSLRYPIVTGPPPVP